MSDDDGTRRDKLDHAFAVNPEICPECADDGERVVLRGGSCPACDYEFEAD